MQTKAQVIKDRAEFGLIGSTWGKEGVFLEGSGSRKKEIVSQREMEG